MKRRDFVALAWGAVALPIRASAQSRSGKVYRIGYLGFGTPLPHLREAFHQGLRDLGWVEGKNLLIEYRYAEGQPDRLPRLADELVRLNVDLIAASPTPSALAAKKATQKIPIVGISFDNPVQNGLVASLARPGGNVTGISYSAGPEIFGKDLELLKELVPGLRHVAVLFNSTNQNPNQDLMISNVQAAARLLSIELLLLDARGPDEFDRAFAAMTRERVGALFVYGDPMFGVHRVRLADLALRNRIPTMYTNRPHVEAGGLMCYAPSFFEIWRRAATYVDRILKGAKPADLPVEQPTKFELVINLKTAKALGITIPPAVRLRADEVIE